MKKVNILCLLLAMLSTPVVAQQPDIKYEVEAQAIGTTNDIVPFWMRSNQFGSIPSEGASGSFIGRVHKEYENNEAKKVDWGAGFEGRANAGSNSKLLLIEAYGKVKAGIFQFKAGRTKDIMGFNGDSILTSGNFTISGNALGIPKIELSIPEYFRLPILNGTLSVKGNFAHGWLGKLTIREELGSDRATGRPYPSFTDNANTFFHQKSLYLRIGKENQKLNLFGGMNHQVFWGNEDQIYGPNFQLSTIKTLFHVATGKAYGSSDIARSKVGNHIGSIDLGMQYDLNNLRILVYRQNFYETGALGKLANLRDGLNGIVLENRQQHLTSRFSWKKILFEFLYTKNQAGEDGAKPTNSGDEDYYNNYIYKNGWSYKNIGLGSPFLSSRNDTRTDLINDPSDYFINNRVIALHLGLSANVYKWNNLFKISYSRNFGTFATSKEGRTTGTIKIPPRYGIFKEVAQLSTYIEGTRNVNGKVDIGYFAAFDKGDLLNNSVGIGLKITRKF